MSTFFTFATNEASSGSVYYLGSIFGVVGQVLAGTGSGVLGSMFKIFNTAVLAIGTMIITYTSGMGIVLTAHEGEMLGKKFHSIWVPMRTIMGMAALVPAATGYSYLQVALMWFILQGVGAADTLWTATVNYAYSNGGNLAPAAPGATTPSVAAIRNNLGTLFKGLACQAGQKATGITSSGYLCTGTGASSNFCTQSDTDMLNVLNGPQVSGNTYSMGFPTGSCGTLTLGAGGSVSDAALNNALQLVVPTLGSIAAQLVNIDDSYATFVGPLSAAQTPPPSAPPAAAYYCSINSISSCTPSAFAAYGLPSATTVPPTYTGIVDDIYTPYIASQYSDFLTTQAVVIQQMVSTAAASQAASSPVSLNSKLTDNGWIFAGAFFYELARQNNTTSSAVVGVQVTPPSNVTGMASLAMNEAGEVVNKLPVAQAATTSYISVGSCTILGVIPLGTVCDDIVSGWMSALSGQSGGGSGNPVVSAQQFGTTLLSTTEAALETAVLAVTLLALTGTIILGNGVPVAPLVVEMLVLPVLFFFVAVFLGVGGTLAVYTPLIPFMLFAFGAINWMIATIETMIAAPIIAIGILYPEGGHDLWGKAEKAIELLLNIFLRPSLMIFGMIAALLMSYVSMTLVNQSFIYTVNEMIIGAPTADWNSGFNSYGTPSGHTGIIEMVFFMVIYTSIFTTVMGKCFELIHVIPDRILRWIGGGGETFGEAGQAAEKAGQGFQQGAQTATGAAKGAGEGATAAGQKRRSDVTGEARSMGIKEGKANLGAGGKATPKASDAGAADQGNNNNPRG